MPNKAPTRRTEDLPLSRAFFLVWDPCGITRTSWPGHSTTSASPGRDFLCQQGFVTENSCAEQPLTGKSRKTEDGVASRLFSTLELLPHRSSSSPCTSSTALNPGVPHKPFTQVQIAQVGASRGELGHKEASCHLGKQDTAIRLRVGLITWNQQGRESSSSGCARRDWFPKINQESTQVFSLQVIGKSRCCRCTPYEVAPQAGLQRKLMGRWLGM